MRGRRAVILVAAATGLGVGAGGCGGSAQRGSGNVLLTVTVPDDVRVKAATYMIDDKVGAPVSGTMSAAQPEHELVKLIGHVPAGAGYLAAVQAASPDGLRFCQGAVLFKVMKNATTRLTVALTCQGGGGHLVVGIGVSCRETPLVDFVVSPLAAPVGGTVIGRAVGARPDGGPLTFAWSAPSGTFASPQASQTAFVCTKPGLVEVLLKVEDDEQCEQSYSAMVSCLDAGDGGQDADGGQD